MDLILASTSPYRRALLERLGLPFHAVAPGVDEDEFKLKGLAPRDLSEALARAKGAAIAAQFPDATIIGSDQVAEVDGLILDKPGTFEAAVIQLQKLAGKEHRLITAIAVIHRDMLVEHTDITTLTMRDLDKSSIRRYVEADRPLDCAGSYKLESRGITLFVKIDSQDHSAIVGLPLIALTTILRTLGFSIP